MTAQCARCPPPCAAPPPIARTNLIAIASAAFVLLIVMCSTNLMSVETAGIKRVANLFSGPEELVQRNMSALAVVVVFVTVLAPVGRLVATLYVLIRLHEAATAAPFAARLRPGRAAAARGR